MKQPKPLLPWKNGTLLENQIASLLEGGANEVIVVTGANVNQLVPLLQIPNVRVKHNPYFASGKASSVRTGASALPCDTDVVILLAVDQPRPSRLIAHALTSHKRASALITILRSSEGGGHPVLFDGALAEELAMVQDKTEGIRQVIRRHEDCINEVCVESSLIRLDINTPEEYQNAVSQYPALEMELSL